MRERTRNLALWKQGWQTEWCENASMLTGTTWEDIKVPQKDFYELQPSAFSDITLIR